MAVGPQAWPVTPPAPGSVAERVQDAIAPVLQGLLRATATPEEMQVRTYRYLPLRISHPRGDAGAETATTTAAESAAQPPSPPSR